MSDEPASTCDDVNTSMTTLTDVTLMTMTYGLPVVKRSHVWTADVIQRVATLLPLMAATLLGNAVTMVVLTCSRYRSVNSRINIFIANLAAGDLAVCCFTMSTEVVPSTLSIMERVDDVNDCTDIQLTFNSIHMLMMTMMMMIIIEINIDLM